MKKELTQTIASEIQLFPSVEQKEDFLFLLGALLARIISNLLLMKSKLNQIQLANHLWLTVVR